MAILRITKAKFDRYMQAWFLQYLLWAVIGTVIINLLPYFKKITWLNIFFWIVLLVIGVVQALKAKKLVDQEYKIAELSETRKGINLYLSNNFFEPIYIPFEWLAVTKSDLKQEFTFKYSKSINFGFRGRVQVFPKNKIKLDDKYLDPTELENFVEIIGKVQKDTNFNINGLDLYEPQEQYNTGKWNFWKNGQVFSWIILLLTIPTVLFTTVVENNTHYVPSKQSTKKKTDVINYHAMYNYSPKMTIKTDFWKFKIEHAYLVKNSQTDGDFVVLNIHPKLITNKDYVDFYAGMFESYSMWTLDKEQNYESIDSADNNPTFVADVNGNKERIVNILREGWGIDNSYNPKSFNIVLKLAKGNHTDILYQAYSDKRTKDDDNDFVLSINKKDLETIK